MSFVDDRMREMAALIDDSRTLAVNIQEEVRCDALTDARHYLNWALAAIERANKELAERATA